MGVQGDFLKKTEALYAELSERGETAPEVILHQAIFNIIVILCLWVAIIRCG